MTDGKPHAADRRSRLRPGDHEHRAHARRARRRRGPRLLPAGRRLPAAPGLDPARRSPRRSRCGAGARRRMLPGQELAAGLAGHRRHAATSPTCCSRAELSAGGLPLLGMGRDIPDGRMFLRNGRLDLDWNRKRSAEYFDAPARPPRATSPTRSAGASPTTRSGSCARVITVHPLGGAPMGRHAGEGVVDPYGNVFGYPGLHIADGSVMPGPVGPEPELHDRRAGRPLRRPDLEPDRRAAEAAAA